jgi:hypothetical protein
MNAFGTGEVDFFSEILSQLANVSVRDGKVSERELNFMVDVVKGIQPKDQLETMLAVQMAVVHSVTIDTACRLNGIFTLPQLDIIERALNKLARTFSAQMEALKRYRTGGEQRVTVKHVTVNEGGKAIVGNVMHGGPGGLRKTVDDLMNVSYPFQKSPRCSATSKRTRNPCQAPAVKGWTVCRFHGARGGGPKGKRNGMYRHGLFTIAAIEERRMLQDLLKQCANSASLAITGPVRS